VASVELRNLTKIFHGPGREEIVAVNDLSLSVTDKEFIVLVGPSGCGKTTTLRLIAGLEDVSAGRISIGASR
jgi:multiple sugar transport system ATP-binding protein